MATCNKTVNADIYCVFLFLYNLLDILHMNTVYACSFSGIVPILNCKYEHHT